MSSYTADISRRNPTAFFFILDQSYSMTEPLAGTNSSKATMLATVINRLLNDIVLRCTSGEEVRHYFDVALIGYGNPAFGRAGVGSALGGALSGRDIVSIADLANQPIRFDQIKKKVPDGAGNVIEMIDYMPIWVEPSIFQGDTSAEHTPMQKAMAYTFNLISDWVDAHSDSFPPLVIHISDGEPNDGDPRPQAEAIRELRTTEGNVLLFNLQLSKTVDSPVIFPADPRTLPDDPARLLFAMSSLLPAWWSDSAAETMNIQFSPNARAFICNRNLRAILQFVEVGTRSARMPLPQEVDINLSAGWNSTTLQQKVDIDVFAVPSIHAIARADEAAPLADPVAFTAYYPRSIAAEQRASLIVYAHLAEASAQIAQDARKFTEELGGTVPRPRSAAKTAQIARGTSITVILECPDLTFDPPSLTRRWDDDWVRFLFEFKLPAASIGESLGVDVSILVSGIEVARITNCAIEVLPPTPKPVDEPQSGAANPLAAAKQRALDYNETTLYQKIFVSYSRADSAVVLAYKHAQEALGNEIFVDTYSIRAGQDWQLALAQAIDSADVMQLFWSDHSAASQNVRDEWEYALQHRCAYDGCRQFIRPVYWTNPLPVKPPAELNHLNFRFSPLGD